MLIIIAIILNFAAVYFIFHYFRWKLTTHNFLEGYEKKKDEIGKEINLMLTELNKATERNLQIMEAKINQLNELVAKADESITKSEKVFSALKKEKEITENSENIYQKLERKSINGKIEEAAKVNSRREVSSSASAAKEESKVTASKSEQGLFDDVVDAAKVTKEELHEMGQREVSEKVINMYKNGIDIEFISRNLGITSGEVELIISISKIK